MDTYFSTFLGLLITVVIISVNYFLRTLVIWLITNLRENTQSKRLSSITIGIMIAQFFNTGILLTLVNANMTEHSPKFITKYIKSGKYYDYSPLWYS